MSGASTVEQNRSNIAAMEVKWDDAAGERLLAVAESPHDYWAKRSRMLWN